MLSPEIVNVAHTLLRDVVLNGTARRLAGGFTLPDGKTLDVRQDGDGRPALQRLCAARG